MRLPKFNTDTPAVREFLWNVGRHWIDFGADGWRLDVAHEIDDRSFWAEFRNARSAPANPEAYIVGEVWEFRPFPDLTDFDAGDRSGRRSDSAGSAATAGTP